MQGFSVSTPPLFKSDVITVTALNQAVAQLLERTMPLTWVSGEISNFTRAASGHWYFTLKDSGAQVRAVMFRGRAQYSDFMPKEGDKVEVRALVSLYAPRGDYQINVEAIRRAGVGNLYEAFLRLKAQLGAEGLFDPERKRPLPYFARRIGIVTSLQAAALRDVLTTLQRRVPHAKVILYPTPVQGEGAGNKIAQSISTASAREECDVLIVCRGGGSIEDLWAFNEEIVARTIAQCTMPVISGVGHETDFTIADFAADLRAPTPTAAAELAATPTDDWLAHLAHASAQLLRTMQRRLRNDAQALDWATRRLQSPLATIATKRLQLQNATQRLRYSAHLPMQQAQSQLQQLKTRLRAPDTQAFTQHLNEHRRRLNNSMQASVQRARQQIQALNANLELLSPQRTLERGYAVIRNQHGDIVRSSKDIQVPSVLHITTAADSADVSVNAVQRALEAK
jgi:exodeoxyribonuclease VII large subunit